MPMPMPMPMPHSSPVRTVRLDRLKTSEQEHPSSIIMHGISLEFIGFQLLLFRNTSDRNWRTSPAPAFSSSFHLRVNGLPT